MYDIACHPEVILKSDPAEEVHEVNRGSHLKRDQSSPYKRHFLRIGDTPQVAIRDRSSECVHLLHHLADPDLWGIEFAILCAELDVRVEQVLHLQPSALRGVHRRAVVRGQEDEVLIEVVVQSVDRKQKGQLLLIALLQQGGSLGHSHGSCSEPQLVGLLLRLGDFLLVLERGHSSEETRHRA